MAEIQKLLQENIPADRQALVKNYTKLQQVAEHCENNYVEAQDKVKALQETKAYATQSLAGVVYQINTLAEKLLRLLDLQASEISNMESSINCLSQRVNMYKEKVARREIGIFTTIRTTPKVNKIIPPSNPIQRVKYTRKPIVYTILDDIGHGVKESSSNSRWGTLTHKNRQRSIPTCPTAPSQGTIGRHGKVVAPVQPPVAPGTSSSSVTNSPPTDGPQLFSDHGRSRSSSGASDKVMSLPPPAPIVYEQVDLGLLDAPALSSMDLPLPPAPPPEVSSDNSLLPPPPPLISDVPSSVTECPPPPPPPPPDYMLDFDVCLPPPPPPIDYSDDSCLTPTNYIEKVVALYAYNKNCEEDLNFKEGEIIYVINKNENGWYEGFINGITGYFPGNYVHPID